MVETTVKVVAHRGSTKGSIIQENTLPAFERAIMLGADYIETDLRKTVDGQIVCVHDETIQGKKVKYLTYAALKKRGVPKLEEVLHLCKGRIRLNLELKEQQLEAELIKLVNQSDMSHEIIVTSFDLDAIRMIQRMNPIIQTGVIIGKRNRFQKRRLRLTHVDLVCVHYSLLTDELMTLVENQGSMLWVWTVNNRSTIQKCLKKNIDGVITDEVTLCRNVLMDHEAFR
ncbi:glycerophosphodiester phosphodiesterase [Geomicrobium sp. JCM 19038]|uniref:glycerophosphodiester phosphodiesterase n=1 Tax=Geomicrobium sp. JCM 19038 TaxID=1460635 RepID=UPI00045F4CF7|nr:glycerophosphodiester phosphodiesterase [Geomicrobium sp. JCM 19038]GAK08580.1 glycerophosphoryl diester phosphodiesterase [Geomicrobium sp. JCM 19038]